MTYIQAFSEGVTETKFWGLFVQCMACKLVMFGDSLIHHKCQASSMRHKPRHHPYCSTSRRVRARLGASLGDRAEPRALPSLRASPVPTEVDERDEGADQAEWSTSATNGNSQEVGAADAGNETEIIPPSNDIEVHYSSDDELPTVLEIMQSVSRSRA